MNTHTPSSFLNGYLLSVAGILLAVFLAGGLVWSDIEAVFYGFPTLTNEPFGGLSCPPLMTRSETASLRVTVGNQTDRPISPLIRVEISGPGLLTSQREKTPTIQPGKSVTLEWPLSEENIDLERFIFAKAFRYPDYRTRLAEDTCGILVVNVPLPNGTTLLALWLGTSILLTLGGMWLLEQQPPHSGKPISLRRGLRLAAVFALAAVLFGLRGDWPLGLLMLVVLTLLAIVLIYFWLTH
ncbi:MAG: hypothetical protein NZP74_06495 [Anaerolineales bacterium]|nr:hypothetical protein [Anaerolineales bacterium]MDW8278590.1 hypothetical protein [Anaerolineales bacterium]